MPPQLNVTQLFQPAPSGVGPYGTVNGATVGAVPQTPGAGSWLATLLYIADTVQLPTTSWQPGDPERTILAAEAVCFAISDAVISQMAQGSFLSSAASGTVLYMAPDGTQVVIPVTPDPSNPAQNPTGAPGYEDLLSQGVYGVYRLAASYVQGPLAIVKLSAGTLNYGVGAYHVGGLGGATYRNQAALSIPSSLIAGTGGVITAITPGFSSTVLTTQSAHGLTVGQSVYLNVPLSTNVTGLAGVFAIVTAVTTTTFVVALSSAGTYSGSGANVYLCTVANMVADVIGLGSNAGPGTVTTAITQNANVFVSNVVGWSGSNWENNQALLGRCQASLAARSPNGPSQAYVYFAETAAQLLAAATPPYALTNGPVQASEFATPATGIVITVVGSATPVSNVLGANVTPGVSQLPIVGVNNANPCVVSCAGPTGLAPGQSFTVSISAVLGTTSVNGTFVGTYIEATQFSIPIDTTLAPIYIGGGSVEGGDLGQIDQLIQQNVVPDDTTAVTTSALALPVQITATVTVPTSFIGAYTSAVQVQLLALMRSYPIGGPTPNDAATNLVSYDDVVAALGEAGVISPGQASVAHVQSLSINSQGSGLGVAFISNLYQALLANPLITVLGV